MGIMSVTLRDPSLKCWFQWKCDGVTTRIHMSGKSILNGSTVAIVEVENNENVNELTL